MKDNNQHRRHAIQVVCALPEDTEDAVIVLRMATQLVTEFLSADEPKKPASVVTLIGGGECA